MSSSGEDASGSDTDDTDDEDAEAAEERRRKEEEEEWGVGVMAANPEEPIPLIDETNRWVAQVALRRTMGMYIAGVQLQTRASSPGLSLWPLCD